MHACNLTQMVPTLLTDSRAIYLEAKGAGAMVKPVSRAAELASDPVKPSSGLQQPRSSRDSSALYCERAVGYHVNRHVTVLRSFRMKLPDE